VHRQGRGRCGTRGQAVRGRAKGVKTRGWGVCVVSGAGVRWKKPTDGCGMQIAKAGSYGVPSLTEVPKPK
jgi:hypothetical protein